MKKLKIIILLFTLYIIFHLGRLYEFNYTQEKINKAIGQKLSACLLEDFSYLPTDQCLYNKSGYIPKE